MKRDVAATEAAGFADERSWIAHDGRQILYGKDWQARKLELWERCGGKCEMWSVPTMLITSPVGEHVLNSKRCMAEADDPHHIIPRSKGRDDRLANLQALCRYHHNLLDKRKTRFGEGRGAGKESQI